MNKRFIHMIYQKSSFLIALMIIGILCIHSSKESSASQVSYGPITEGNRSAPTVQAGLFDSDEECNAYLSPKKRQLVEGDSFQLSVKDVPKKYKVSFKCSDTSVINLKKTSSKKADIEAVSSGDAQVLVRIYQKRGFLEHTIKTLTCNVEVGPKAISIKLKRTSLVMRVGKSKKLGYTLKPNNTCEKPVFESSNPRKLTITSSGKMKARAAGKVKVTASIAAGKSATCTVNIRAPKKQK